MLEFIYYPVSFILWCWHEVFAFVFGSFGPTAAIAWILAIAFLTFTIRGIMFKPFVNQVRSMKKMQDFAPEMKRVQKKYANDKQRQAQEMQKLQREHGVNPLGSCLPMLLQVPVFIGLNWVLRAFGVPPEGGTLEDKEQNYFFDAEGVQSYLNADIFGVNIGDAIYHLRALAGDVAMGSGWNWEVAKVSVPLTVVAAIATHFTARHSVARQNQAQMSGQASFMNKITLWVFPIGLLIFGAFFPVGLLIYFLSNNAWTLMQQRLIYKKIDREDEEKKAEAVEKRTALAPKPGQKPQPGQKPASGQKAASGSGSGQSGENKSDAAGSGAGPKKTGASSGSAKSGSSGSAKETTKSARNGSGGSWAKGGGAQRTSVVPETNSGQQSKGNGSAKSNGGSKQNAGSGKKSGRKQR